jgi:hypothetical protein
MTPAKDPLEKPFEERCSFALTLPNVEEGTSRKNVVF